MSAERERPVCDPTWGPPSVGNDVQGGDPNCPHGETVKNPDGSEFGEGFYWICASCGAKGWYD